MKLALFFFLMTTIFCGLSGSFDWKKVEVPEYQTLTTAFQNQSINRPLFHFTPQFGWMNDPNGMWIDSTKNPIVYHLYFQYNPKNTFWDMPLDWGHATSTNLLEWTELQPAFGPNDGRSGAYSGSMFIDDENKSKMFTDDNTNNGKLNLIAAYTFNDDQWKETQYLYFSPDGTDFYNTTSFPNPVVSHTDPTFETQFRDPQVVKFYIDDSTNGYLMSVAKSQEYKIAFYLSKTDLKQGTWDEQINLELEGFLGYQYECPNLAHLKNNDKVDGKYNEEDSSYWVLFISINPGSQQGGSSTEYFIGQLNVDTTGETGTVSFTYINNGYTTLLDLGKDFYAMQLFYEPPSDTDENSDVYAARNYATGIAWASNWQYTALVPTDPWRSSTSLPRHIKIAHYSIAAKELLYIFSKPCIDLSKVNTTEWKTAVKTNDLQYDLDLSERAYGALEFEFEFTVADSFTNDDPGVITLYLYGLSVPEEYLRVGFNQKADAFFIDRGHTNVQFVHNNPFFTDKLSVNVYGTSAGSTTIKKKRTQVNNDTNLLDYDTSDDFKEQDISKFKVHGIVDRNIIELFFNEVKDNENDDFGWSALSSTNTFFFTGGNFIGTLKVEFNSPTKVLGETTENVGFDNISLRGRQLNPFDE